jgi:hypothetical protein
VVGRHVWKVFVGLGLLVVLFGLGDMASGGATFEVGEAVLFNAFTGTTWAELQASDPAAARFIDLQVRLGGLHLVAVGLLTLAIAVTGLRAGERWAWLAMWIWPLWSGTTVAVLLATEPTPGAGTPVPVISGSVILVLSALVLVLSYPRYGRGTEAPPRDRG